MKRKLKIVSIDPVDEKTLAKIKDIYATAKNPNGVMIREVPGFKFAQGYVLYFCDQTKRKSIQEIEVDELE